MLQKDINDELRELDTALAEKYQSLNTVITQRLYLLADPIAKKGAEAYETSPEVPQLRQQAAKLHRLNYYIYEHSISSYFVTNQTNLEAKRMVKQAYDLIDQIIKDPTMKIDAVNLALFKIHDNNVRDAVALIVATLIFIALIPVVLYVGIVAGFPIACVLTSMIPIVLTALAITQTVEKFINMSASQHFYKIFATNAPIFFSKPTIAKDSVLLSPANDAATEKTSSAATQPL